MPHRRRPAIVDAPLEATRPDSTPCRRDNDGRAADSASSTTCKTSAGGRDPEEWSTSSVAARDRMRAEEVEGHACGGV